MLHAYLVDDELHTLNMLDMFLVRTGKVVIAGRSGNGFEALEALRLMRPQVWFLDIEMPGMNGLELAEHIQQADPSAAIVFTTAYDQYAIAAFELAAIDYLLKPVEMGRLSRTVDRLEKEIEWRQSAAKTVPEPPQRETLDVYMLGTFRVASSSGSGIAWRTAKVKELFAYLLLHLPNANEVHRDRIIERLWPDEPYEKAKIYLHTCISLLRKNLRQIGFAKILGFEKECYVLDPDQIRSDVHRFEAGFQAGHVGGSTPIAGLEQSLELYRGDLLGKEDYPWAVELSHQLEKTAVVGLLKLSQLYLAEQSGKKAAEAAERAMDLSPYEEEAYRLAMQAYLMMGKHDHVLRTYQELKERLGELQIQPSALTRQLYELIATPGTERQEPEG
ncbi:response regulator [Paenibacillus hodogayensis]|uniref:Response regulator n=1 Tax=Paenibacillus hodogayensis TaxID=279208 RepID=A0ABV5VPR3_9BACL